MIRTMMMRAAPLLAAVLAGLGMLLGGLEPQPARAAEGLPRATPAAAVCALRLPV